MHIVYDEKSVNGARIQGEKGIIQTRIQIKDKNRERVLYILGAYQLTLVRAEGAPPCIGIEAPSAQALW